MLNSHSQLPAAPSAALITAESLPQYEAHLSEGFDIPLVKTVLPREVNLPSKIDRLYMFQCAHSGLFFHGLAHEGR